MVLIISWWVQPTVIWPYKACSLSWAASNVWYMLKFLLPGSRRTFFKFGHELLFIFFRTHVLWMFLEEGERLLFGLFIFFAKNAWADCAIFLMRNYQRSGLIMIYSSQGLTAHTEETDTHQYYLRWPVALSERQVAVPVCSRRKGGAPGTADQ